MLDGRDDLVLRGQRVQDDPDEPGVKIHEMSFVRQFPADEYVKYSAARSLLSDVIERTGYGLLVESADGVHDAIAGLRKAAFAQQPAIPSAEMRRVHQAFRLWLSAFVSFDAYCASFLRKCVNPSAKEEFRQRLRDNYDSNFAYRMCATLRNVSEHASTVISGVTVEAKIESNESITRTFHVYFTTHDLAKHSDLKASIRRELSDAGRHQRFSVDAVVDSVMRSCNDAYTIALRLLADKVREASSVVTNLYEEVVHDDVTGAQIATPLDRGFEYEWIDPRPALVASNNLRLAVVEPLEPPPSVTLERLIAASTPVRWNSAGSLTIKRVEVDVLATNIDAFLVLARGRGSDEAAIESIHDKRGRELQRVTYFGQEVDGIAEYLFTTDQSSASLVERFSISG